MDPVLLPDYIVLPRVWDQLMWIGYLLSMTADFLAIWSLTLLILLYSFVLFLPDGYLVVLMLILFLLALYF